MLLAPITAGFVAATATPWDQVGRAVGVGFAGGIAGGLIAGAIGLVSVPLIAIFLGLPVHQAAATNLFQTIFTAASGAGTHARRGNVNLRLALPLLAGALVGAPLGAWTSIGLPEVHLRAVFSIILVMMAANLVQRIVLPELPRSSWLARFDREGHGRTWLTRPIRGTFRGHDYNVSPLLAVGLGAGIGFTSGLLGIGGGFLVTPLVATFLHVPTRLAVGTGLVVISGNSVFGTLTHLWHGNVLFTIGFALAVGGSIGAQIGSRLSHHLPERTLFFLFTVALLLVAMRMAPL